MAGFEGVPWVERERRHVTEVEERIVVLAVSAAVVGVVSAVGVQSTPEFVVEEPEEEPSQCGQEV